jgi:hypothetical protein
MSRVRERNALIVCEIRAIIFTNASALYFRHFGNDFGGTIISIVKDRGALEWTRVSTSSTDCRLNCLEGVYVGHCVNSSINLIVVVSMKKKISVWGIRSTKESNVPDWRR